MNGRRRQSGFAYIAAIVLLVVVAGISVALIRLTDTQQSTVNQALLGARANLAARGGIEWAFYRLREVCTTPPAAPATSQLSDFDAASGFRVSVSCTYRSFGEGEEIVPDGTETPPVTPLRKRIYRIEAVACNGGGACPDANAVTRADYVERARVATVCETEAGNFCD